MPKAAVKKEKPKEQLPQKKSGYALALDAYAAEDFEAALRHIAALSVPEQDSAEVANLRGLIQKSQGEVADAIRLFNRALRLRPEYVSAFFNRAKAFQSLNMFAFARRDYGMVASLDSGNAHIAFFNIAAIAQLENDTKGAIEYLDKAIAAKPDYHHAYNNRANLKRKLLLLQEALDDYKKAIEIDEKFSEGLSNLAGLTREVGFLEESVDIYKRALTVNDKSPVVFSNYIYALCHSENIRPDLLFKETKRFSRCLPEPVGKIEKLPAQKKSRYRIGFIGGDFFDHVVSQWFIPLLREMKSPDFEVFLYYNNSIYDGITQKYRELASAFRDVFQKSDDQVLEWIRSDSIDVLIDLSGHSGKNRLPVFARRAAPVQATWLGHPFTTGLESVDYVITAAEGDSGQRYSDWTEKFLIIPGVVAFPPHTLPERTEPPFLKNGHITFGSFNRNSKLGVGVLDAWARILQQVPGSRLVFADISIEAKRAEIVAFFKSRGISADRLSLAPRCVTMEFLKLHNTVDIALDTWPFSGGITASNCLHLGLPYVSMQGPTYASRVASIMLQSLSLQSWVARDPKEYISIAVAKAADPSELVELRRSIPLQLQTSPVFSASHIVQGFFTGLRYALQRAQAGKPPSDIQV
jgi:predicted O-linked N-acetylglucosamine transferase (SPINDLY family)